jgi:mRNA-degrading endonuclease RelE of RelBE toxin-antitoxin system
MPFHIHLQPDAVADLDSFRKFDVSQILDGIEEHLRHQPAQESRARIKKLRGKQAADYRLMVGEFRVFYCIGGKTVKVLRVLSKEQTKDFYQ